ncbi:MAG: HDOD domain-containing protein [Eubacteriales bacterium]|nr:HDOD domain-containing protein [Eubacteriales bacterium]
MIPTTEEARQELELAGQLNPGPWTAHSVHVGRAAQEIAQRCPGLDGDKAYALGLLHDIGRRYGVSARRHGIDGYRFLMEKGWGQAARVCLTHSFPVADFTKEMGKNDMTGQQSEFVQRYLQGIVYDDYDKLLILCDSLATAQGFCLLEKRFVDTARRYGVFPFTVERWNATFAIKEYFEKQMRCCLYDILPNVKETTFLHEPLWQPPVR